MGFKKLSPQATRARLFSSTFEEQFVYNHVLLQLLAKVNGLLACLGRARVRLWTLGKLVAFDCSTAPLPHEKCSASLWDS